MINKVPMHITAGLVFPSPKVSVGDSIYELSDSHDDVDRGS